VSAAVIIPVRGFRDAKGRLAGALDPAEREALAITLLLTVMAAAAPLPILVVSSDPEVARVVGSDAAIVEDPGTGLDDAVMVGVATAAQLGCGRAVVAHGDLPFPAGLAELGTAQGIVLVPDRRLDGTNVISIPVDLPFRFHYGPGSFDRHLAEARGVGVEPTVLGESRLSWDVDLPEDLVTPSDWGPPPWEGPT
jgi:2-phospho-L-lactate guanylyltransferase